MLWFRDTSAGLAVPLEAVRNQCLFLGAIGGAASRQGGSSGWPGLLWFP